MKRPNVQPDRRPPNRAGSRGAECAVCYDRSAWVATRLRTAAALVELFVVVLVVASFVAGCQSNQPSPGQSTQGKSPEASSAATTEVIRKSGIRTEKELGPVRVTVEVTPAPARLSDEPTLTITVIAETGVEVELPPFGEAVGEFDTLDFREPLVEIRGDREVSRQVYVLEPHRTGSLEIDPVIVTFTDTRPGQEPGPQRLETEALSVEVVSLQDAEAPSLDDLQGFAPPVELPRRFWWWPWVLAGTLLSLVVAAGIVWRLRRQARERRLPELTPREIASLALKRIWQDQLHVHDIKRFYTELTGIVRRYIEGSVGVHAPEQTTEEFLREISSGQVFSEDERRRLRDFLESSDLVKFAAHRPDRGDIDDAYKRARVFVGIEREQESGQTEAADQQVSSHD